MTDLNLESGEKIICRVRDAAISDGNTNNSLDGLFLTNKHLVSVHEKSLALFSKDKFVVDKKPLDLISNYNGEIQVSVVKDDEFDVALHIFYNDGTDYLYSLGEDVPGNAYQQWEDSIKQAILENGKIPTDSKTYNAVLPSVNSENVQSAQTNIENMYTESTIAANIEEKVDRAPNIPNVNVIFCSRCGEKNNIGARFCQRCGTSLATRDTSDSKEESLGESGNMQFTYNERKKGFSGEIVKCPNCGEILQSFLSKCPSCGHELRGVTASNSIKDFSMKMEKTTSTQQKATLIRNFPIPNTKEDILEFMILSATNFNANQSLSDDGEQKEISDAWFTKTQQCYQKASLLFKNDDEDFIKIKRIYDENQKSIASVKIRRNTKNIFELIFRNIAVWIGIIIVIVALVMDWTGENSSMIELIGYIVLIVSACTLGKRKAPMIDFGIGALSGVITIGLSFLMDNGSMGELCGGIVLVIVVVNFFKSTGHKQV